MTRRQKHALVFAAIFLVVFIITNIPAFNDAQGRNFGLFKIDPIDNVVHLLTAILGALAAWKSPTLSKYFLMFFGIAYALDAAAGMFLQRGLLDGSFLTMPGGSADLGVTNFLINAPHIGIAALMIWAGFAKDKPARS